MLPDCSEFRSRTVQMFGYVFRDTNGPNHVRKWRSRGTYLTKLVRSSINRIAMRERIRRSFIWAWMREGTKLGMYVRSSETRIILIGKRGCHQDGREKGEHGSDVEGIDEKCGSWRTNIMLGRGILKKKKNRETIHFKGEYGNIDLLYRTVHDANQLCIYGAVSKWCGPNSGEASQSRPDSARKMSPEIPIKQADLKSLVDIPKQQHASGNRILQNLKDFNSMPFVSKIEYLRTTAKFYHPIEKGNYFVTTTLDNDGWR